jgi:hypothetical protein
MMSAWLNEFAYRIDLSILPFVSAGLLSVAFAMATVGSQAYRAAKTDPIDALRYEWNSRRSHQKERSAKHISRRPIPQRS